MTGQAAANVFLKEMRNETIRFYNRIVLESRAAGLDNRAEMKKISTLIDERRYASAQAKLELIESELLS